MKNNYKKILVLCFSVMFGFVMAACDSTGNSNSNSVDDTSDSSEHTHSYTEEVTKEATCTETGIKTFTCGVCGDTYEEEISKVAHALTHHEASDSTCNEPGNIEHWVCDVCGGYFLQEGPTTADAVVIPAKHKHLTHVAAVGATCYEAGNVEHWVCSDCGEYFLDEALTSKTTADAVVVAAKHKHLTHVAAVDATCYEAGNVEHWVCSDCGDYFLDEALTNKTTADAVVVAAGHKHLTHVAAVDATCYEDGNVEHWVCSDCGDYFLDEALTNKTTADAVVVAATQQHVLGEYYVSGVAEGVVTLKRDCTTDGCSHFETTTTPAPTNYSINVSNEETLASIFTVDRSSDYTFEWVDGVLRNTNSEVSSSQAVLTLVALQSGKIVFDTAVCSESNYDYLVVYHNTEPKYSSKQSSKNGIVITKTVEITFVEGDIISFNKRADGGGFHGPDGDKDYAKIYNIEFYPTEVPSDASYVIVSFETNGGEAINPVVAFNGKAVQTVPTATKEGYHFLGWTSDANNEVAFDAASGVTANTTVYAKWLSNDDVNPLYGEYDGKNVYGAGFAAGTYTLSVDVLGNLSGYLTGSITSYDPATGLVTWTNGTATGQFLYNALTKVIAVKENRPQAELNLGSDYYVFASEVNGIITSVSFYDSTASSSESYRIKLIQLGDGETANTILIKDGVIYANVTYTSLFGTITNLASIKNISDVVVKDANGNVLVAQGYNGSKLVDLDEVYGIYTNEDETLKVSGISSITLNDVVGTYVYEDGIIKATIDGVYYEITVDGDSFTKEIPMTTVVYNTLGGNTIENGSVNTTTAIGTLSVPTKDGFVFRGWYLNEECSGRAINSTYVVSGETLTIYAKWVEAVTLTFNSNEGSSVESITLGSGEAIEAPEDPTREGYRFDGWYTDNTFVTVFEFTDGITSNTEVVAKWVKVWTVTVNSVDGSSESTVAVVDDGATYEVKAGLFSEGLVFKGLYTTATFDEGSEFVNGSVITSDVTIYCKWVAGKYANDAANFIDSFDTNGYISNVVFDDTTYPWNIATYKDELWIVSTNQGKSSSKSIITIYIAKSASLSFDYLTSSEGRYDYLTVTVNGSNEIVNTKTLGAGSSNDFVGTISDYVVSAGDYITFTFSKDGSGNQLQDTAYVNNLVFAELESYTITLNYNDSVTPNGSMVANQGEQVTLPSPTREGYAFKGWTNGEQIVDSQYTPTENVTLAAVWAKLYTVTFNLNNGSDPVVEQVEEGTIAEIDNPVKEGYVFVGWYTDEALTNKYEDVVTSNLSLYAKFISMPSYVGTYNGVEVWGSLSGNKGSYNANKTLTISTDFAMTGGKVGTIDPASYNEATGVLSYSFNSSTYLMYYTQQGGYEFVLLNYSASGTDCINSTDYYVYVKGDTTAAGSNANQYVWDNGAQRVFSIKFGDTEVIIYINATTNEFYGNVSLSTLDGTPVASTFEAINAATSLKITSFDGNTTMSFAKEGVEFVALDGFQGTYEGSLGTITLDGAGTATVGDVTTTYVIEGSKVELLVSGATKTIVLDGDSYTLTTDGTEGTYTGENGTFVSNGDGTATLGGVDATYVKNGLEVTYTCGEASVTILLNNDGTYSCKTAYAGFVYTGNYTDNYGDSNALKVRFDDAATLTGAIVCGSYPEHVFTFSAVVEGNVITFTITSELYKEGCVGKVITATISDSEIVFDSSSDLNNVYATGGSTVTR